MPVLKHLYVVRVCSEIGPFTLDRSIKERARALVDFLAWLADLALGHADATHHLVATPESASAGRGTSLNSSSTAASGQNVRAR